MLIAVQNRFIITMTCDNCYAERALWITYMVLLIDYNNKSNIMISSKTMKLITGNRKDCMIQGGGRYVR